MGRRGKEIYTAKYQYISNETGMNIVIIDRNNIYIEFGVYL